MVEVVIAFIAIVVAIAGYPGYVIATRRGLDHPWVAFVPIFGLWIILCEATGHSGWFALVTLIPTLGAILLSVWMAVEVPPAHGRSRWWTAALIVPLVNLVGYWVYALTLPKQTPIPASPPVGV